MKSFNKIIPTDIISEILARLPTEPVLRCKLVCKTWMNLIHHRSFPQTHLTRLNHPDSTEYGKFRYVFLDKYDEHLYYFEYNDIEDWNYGKPISRKIMIETPFDDYIVIGSFNGLICIYGYEPDSSDDETIDHEPACIFNPVTKEYIVLPYIDSGIQHSHLASGFGYVASTDEYKVVRIYMLGMLGEEPNFVEVEVYTVGSGNGWRHVGRFCFGFRFYTQYQQTHGVFWNGALHWRNFEGGTVVVFDLAGEKFREHIPPPPMGINDDEDNFPVIGVSGGGILYYAVCQSGLELEASSDVWLLMKKDDNHVMREQEENQSWGWSKVTSLEQREPFCFMESGIVLRYDQGTIQMFASNISTWLNFLASCIICCQVYPHKHSLVSLKDLGEEDVLIMGKDFEEIDSSESGSD